MKTIYRILPLLAVVVSVSSFAIAQEGPLTTDPPKGLSSQEIIQRFAAKEKYVPRLVLNNRIQPGGMSAQAKNALPGHGRLEVGKRGMAMNIHLVPVIHASPAKRAIIEPKADAADQMKGCAGRNA